MGAAQVVVIRRAKECPFHTKSAVTKVQQDGAEFGGDDGDVSCSLNRLLPYSYPYCSMATAYFQITLSH